MISVALSAYLAFQAAHLTTVRREAMLSRELHRTALELGEANRDRRTLQAELASRIAREAQATETLLVVAPAVARSSSLPR